MEHELDHQFFLDHDTDLIRELADGIISEQQIENKGTLLGHYVSLGFTRTYIDVYENAVIGKAEIRTSKKPKDICWGYARLARAVVEKGVLYLVMNNKDIYRIRHLKLAEKIAFLINIQKTKK